MKVDRDGQRRSEETGNPMAARVTPSTLTSNMLQAQYGNFYSDSVKADSFQNKSHSISMSTDPVHVEKDTAGPTHLHTDPGPVFNSNLTFDKQLEAIDQDLMKFDNPINVTPILHTSQCHFPSQPTSPHHHSQDVNDTPNLITIPSDPLLTNSTHTSNPNFPTNPNSSPHPSLTSSWKRIFRATIAHTPNLSPVSGSKRALNEDQPELPSKRHAVSQVMEDNK
nr:hypothetical protein CFP56_30616 [Quercus suber]